MKISLSKEQLVEALSVAVTGISTNSTLPVMAGVLIKADEKEVTFEATDLDSSCQFVTTALVEEEGRTVLPGAFLLKTIKTCEDSRVTIVTDDKMAFITCEQASFSMPVLNANEFPGFPEIQCDSKIEIPCEKFQMMIKKVIKAASKDESKGVYTGVLVEVKEGKVRAVTCDTYRVAIAEETVETAAGVEFSAVIPPHFLNEITGINGKNETLTLAYNENQVIVQIGRTTFINRKLQGEFPPYQKIINTKNETTVIVEKTALMAAIKRVSVFIDENTPIVFDVDIEKEIMQLSVSTPTSGTATELISVLCTGESCNVGFKGTYINDGLASVTTNDVLLTLSAKKEPAHVAPCVVKRDEFSFDEVKETEENMLNNKFLYLVMPILQTN